MPPIVTLTTDFGTRDSYVAQVKGVLLRLGPEGLCIVDLGHEIAPQAVREAAFFLRSALPQFPHGTIHLAVVDPGVGSARRPLAVSSGGQLLVGPDNGLFGLVLHEGARVHRIASESSAPPVSSTFHARDVFAPAAARLARGEPLAALGPVVTDPVQLPWPAPMASPNSVVGEVVHIDRYGNLISSIARACVAQTQALAVELQGRAAIRLVDHYAEAAPGELIALFGSDDLLEIAARDASAAATTGARVGAHVEVRLARRS